MRLALQLEFLSDWHVGSGTSTPEIDALVVRDQFGFPQVPAKSLAGVWRQQVERVAAALGSPGDGWAVVPDLIFGTQQNLAAGATVTPASPSRLTLTPLRTRKAVRTAVEQAVKGTGRGGDLTVIRPGVRIDPATGVAMDKFLRSVEHGRAGAVVWGTAAVDLDDLPETAAQAALAVLVAGGSLLERIGGNRRRGSGRCRLTLHQITGGNRAKLTPSWAAEVLLSAISDSSKIPARPTAAPRASATSTTLLVASPGPPSAATATAASASVTFDLRLALQLPLGVTSQVSGNVHETLDHVPGSVVLAWAAAQLQGATTADLRPSILAGRLRVTPATLEIAGKASRPTPASYGQAKGSDGGPGTVANRLVERLDGEVQVKDLRGGWVAARDDGSLLRHSAPITVHAHNTIEDALQRPTSDVGGLYLYEAISPVWPDGSPVTLRASVTVPLSETTLDHQTVQKALTGEARLGRSSKDDYGLVSVEVVKQQQETGGEHPEGNASEGDPHSEATRVVMWCTSDLLVDTLEPGGAPTLDDVRRALAAALGVDQENVEPVEASARTQAGPFNPEGCWLRHRRIESFHRRWQLPRPTLLVVAAGSVFTWKITTPGQKSLARLAELAVQGLGRRRAEGFGAVVFNDPVSLMKLSATGLASDGPGRGAPPADPAWQTEAPDDAEGAHVGSIAAATWQQLIIEQAQQKALDPAWRQELVGGFETTASPSQRGTLRALFAGFGGVLHGSDKIAAELQQKVILEWIAKEKKRANNVDRGRERLDTDALERLVGPARVWELLGIEPPTDEETAERFWPFAVRVAVESALRAKGSRDS